MTDQTENLVIKILQDVQARLGRIEQRMTNLELRMTAQEQQFSLVPRLCLGTPLRGSAAPSDGLGRGGGAGADAGCRRPSECP